MKALSDIESQSNQLGRIGRKFKHLHLKDISSYCIKPKSKGRILAKAGLDNFIVNPAKHFYYSTEQNKTFGFPTSEKKVKQFKAAFDYIKSESPEAHDFMKNSMQEMEGTAAKRYHVCLFLGSLGCLVTGNFLPSGILAGLLLAESKTARWNLEESSYHTGIVGTIRDKLGLSKKLISPFDLVSKEYDLGMWRDEDLS